MVISKNKPIEINKDDLCYEDMEEYEEIIFDDQNVVLGTLISNFNF